ncbi:hypothetical protein [Acidobacterium sp. S8]|uniref:hypothetical protein n=1 Tax=Acidobacterium sp. S8 TaxID=1641854 RepID=UPI00131ABE51|nr:hypothetical protein [Acidobacterium sp. S8]
MNKRPLIVTIVSWIFLVTGAISVVYHFMTFHLHQAFLGENALLSVRLLAIVCGAFMFMGRNWARWLALAWMAFHVALSFFHSLQEALVHSVIFLLIAYALFRPEARAYFRPASTRDA